MPTLGIESNGLLEKTAIYYNGEQISGIKELFLNMDEDGTFDAIIQYEGSDKQVYTKQIFSDYLDKIKTSEPSFTEDDARNLFLLEIESEGDIDTAAVYINEEYQEGITNLYLNIKATENKSSIASLFNLKKKIPDTATFIAQITYRNDDDSIETEDIF